MSTTMKTPGVYIQELDAFGNAVVPVPTAIPAFIGYTAQTLFNGKSLLNKAVKVTSLAEFLMIFGPSAPKIKYTLTSPLTLKSWEDLNAEAESTKKALDAFDQLPAPLTSAQTVAKTAAEKASDDAESALETAKADSNIDALLKAQKALSDAQKALNDANKKDPNGTFAKAIEDANTKLNEAKATLDNLLLHADFVNKGCAYYIEASTINYRMYSSLKFFYENGGGTCYVMSIGGYDYSKSAITDTGDFIVAINLLKKEQEPTMLVIPDVVEIKTSDKNLQDKYAHAYSLQNVMINHCGEMQNRVAILDIPGGFSEPLVGTTSVQQFRDSVEPLDPKFNSYAAVYYPWLHTTVYQTSEISYENIDTASYSVVKQMLTSEFNPGKDDQEIKDIISAFSANNDATQETLLAKADLILKNLSKSYQLLMAAIMSDMNLMAPSAAMAGIYTSVDNNEGVWVAPANVGVQSTVKPAINIDHAAQEDLNMPIDGKSVCAIRAFTGRGNLVWGARTLDGNSNDWRYINVRRTLIYIEQSVQDAAKAYVFAPNDAGTWVNVKSMISNFLNGLWKQGGLVGPKPADAFSVSVGLGSTMTGDDVLNGIMRVAVKVAVSHPAEFIEITFQQQMQKG